MSEIEYKQLNFELKDFDVETGVFEGYASTWDIDLGRDRAVKGCFNKCLETKRFSEIDILFNHDDQEIIGELLEAKEDDTGLYIKAQLYVGDIQRASEVKFLMDKGKLNKMSIGYIAEKKAYVEGIRELKQINLIEISVVKKPMNPNASILLVKSVEDLPEFKSLADIEDLLKGLGCSNAAATAIISKVAEFKKVSDEGEPHEEKSEQGDPAEEKTEEPESEVHDDMSNLLEEKLSNLSNLLKEMKG